MQRRFDEELEKFKNLLFRMGALVEEAVRKSVDALAARNQKLAEEVIDRDEKINMLEIEIDEMGHELIALRQPTAVDLRLITMVLKINSDLERIGDQAVNIAERALVLSAKEPLHAGTSIPKMVDVAIEMVRQSLNALAKKDAAKAKAICERDDEIDDLNRGVFRELEKMVEAGQLKFSEAVSLLMVAHNLERVGDLATNIAEDVIYLTKGVDIRHHITERRGEGA